MKIRSGFVSNSSSSSFIIAYKKPCTCPTCGLTPPDFVSIVGTSENSDSSDNRVRWTDSVIKLKEMEDEIAQYQCDLKKYQKDEHTRCRNDQWIEKTIQRLQNLSQLIQDHNKDGDIVAEIEIDYHDGYLNGMLKELVKNKHICVLESSE